MNNKVESVSAALKSYIASCKANGLANGTIENYERVVNEYISFLKDKEYEEATIGSASEWKIAMSEKGTKITVIASKMSMCKAFFEFACEMQMVERSPFIPTVMPSRKAVNAAKKRPYEHVLSTEDFYKIIRSGKPKGETRQCWLRNRAILVMFLTSAIRNSELRDLTLGDLNFENGSISVNHGKGDKARLVAFPDIAQSAIKDYLNCGYRPLNLTKDDFLFGIYTEDGIWKQMERRQLSKLVERNVKLITGKEGFRSHALRHGCATQYFDRGLDIGSIGDLLGHSSTETTRIYIEKLRPNLPTQKANDLFANEMNLKLV